MNMLRILIIVLLLILISVVATAEHDNKQEPQLKIKPTLSTPDNLQPATGGEYLQSKSQNIKN